MSGALTNESGDVSSAAPAASADLPGPCSRSFLLVVFAFIALAVAEVVLVLMMPGINCAGADGKAAQAEILITLEFARPFDITNLNPLQGLGAAAGDGRDVYPYPPYSARRRGVLGYGIRARTRVGARPRTTIVPRRTTSQCPPSKGRASSIRVIRSDSVNGEVSDPRVSGIR